MRSRPDIKLGSPRSLKEPGVLPKPSDRQSTGGLPPSTTMPRGSVRQPVAVRQGLKNILQYKSKFQNLLLNFPDPGTSWNRPVSTSQRRTWGTRWRGWSTGPLGRALSLSSKAKHITTAWHHHPGGDHQAAASPGPGPWLSLTSESVSEVRVSCSCRSGRCLWGAWPCRRETPGVKWRSDIPSLAPPADPRWNIRLTYRWPNRNEGQASADSHFNIQ